MELAAEPARQLVKPAAGLHIAQAVTTCLLLSARLTVAELYTPAHPDYILIQENGQQQIQRHEHMVAAVKATM
jgi:hypothetical protein